MVLTRYTIECNIIALVYINRITVRNRIAVTMSNWRGLWLGAIILAQKVWDDKPLKTTSFCSILPNLKKEDVIKIEMKVFSLLDYSTTVRPSVYAKYFFELHELFKEITGANAIMSENNDYHWKIQPLTIAEQKKIELRSKRHGREYRKQHNQHQQHQYNVSNQSCYCIGGTGGDDVGAADKSNSSGDDGSFERSSFSSSFIASSLLDGSASCPPGTTSEIMSSIKSSSTSATTAAGKNGRKGKDNKSDSNETVKKLARTLEDVTLSRFSRYVIN
jgi:hypothetical protein